MAANIMTDLEIMSGKVFTIFCDWKKPGISEELCYCFEPRFKERLVHYQKKQVASLKICIFGDKCTHITHA